MSSSIKSYFERKRRDLSDKSTNEKEKKKARKSSLDLSLSKETSDGTDVFAKVIESPRCASILYDCLNNLELKVNEIYELSSSTKDAQIKGAKQLEDVSESIKFINEKFEEYEADLKQKEKEIAELKEDLTSLKEKFFQVERTLDHQEQYSRRNCLLVHGVEEKNNEDTDQEIINIVKNDLGEEITIHDIDRTHRLGKRKLDNNVSRPIIVKFTRYNVRNRIFKTKKKLKGKTVSITESLTKRRVVELKKAREMYGFNNVWSQDGKILFSDVNDRNKVKVFYD